MRTIKYLFSLAILMSFSSPLWAFQGLYKSDDSTRLIKEKIKSDFKKTKSKKTRQIKKIETSDSTIMYAADKLRTQIVLVDRYNKLEKTTLQFTYDEDRVIQIGVIKRIRKTNGKGYKNRYSSYHFDNGKLFYSSQKDSDDNLAYLLSEAERYLKQGKQFL